MTQEQIDEIHITIIKTRALVAKGAMTGFNPKDGDWAEKLFANQHYLSEALKIIEGKRL